MSFDRRTLLAAGAAAGFASMFGLFPALASGGARPNAPFKLSDAEWSVMNVVWERHPACARDVLEALEEQTGWAYTTVKTMLDRLVEKGALTMRKRANLGLYEPAVSRGEARTAAVRSLLDRAFEGAFGSLFQHLAKEERLGARDRERLERLLEELGDSEAKR